MKKLIILLGVTFSLSAFAATGESALITKARSLITQVAGKEWSDKLLGVSNAGDDSNLSMPEIPQNIKTSTDVSSYTRIKKDPTEFDQLPPERRRQFNYKFLE